MKAENDIKNQRFSIKTVPTDDLNAKIGVLTRREVEARILSPVIEALGQSFGRDQVLSVVQSTIIKIAREQGADLSKLIVHGHWFFRRALISYIVFSGHLISPFLN